MSNWLVIPAALLLMVVSLVGVVIWRRWVQTLREPTFDEFREQLRSDLSNVQEELWKTLKIPALIDRLAVILERLDRDS